MAAILALLFILLHFQAATYLSFTTFSVCLKYLSSKSGPTFLLSSFLLLPKLFVFCLSLFWLVKLYSLFAGHLLFVIFSLVHPEDVSTLFVYCCVKKLLNIYF